jgi:hypothetical protein
VPREQLVELLTIFYLADLLNGKINRIAVIFVATDRTETIQSTPVAREEKEEEREMVLSSVPERGQNYGPPILMEMPSICFSLLEVTFQGNNIFDEVVVLRFIEV